MRTAAARRPLTCFLAVALAAGIVLSGDFVDHVLHPYGSVVGLLALLCCWALAEADRPAHHLLARVAIVAAVAALSVALHAALFELFMREWGMPFVPLLEAVGLRQNPLAWLGGLVAGLVLASVLSPRPLARRYARALLAWRVLRSPRLIAVVFLAPVVLAAAALLVEALAPAPSSPSLDVRVSAASLLLLAALTYLASVPLVFAWYGFAAERLGRRFAPLGVALLIGLATALPRTVATLVSAALEGELYVPASYLLLELAGGIALAVVAVWLTRSAGGSLLPATLFLVLSYAAGIVVFDWPGEVEAAVRAGDIYAWLLVALALFVALAGRMWRRQTSPGAWPASAGALDGRPGATRLTSASS